MFASFGMLSSYAIPVPAAVASRSILKPAASFQRLTGFLYQLPPSYLPLKHQARAQLDSRLSQQQEVEQEQTELQEVEQEQTELLVSGIEEELIFLENGSRTSVQSLTECLTMVDFIQRLGIDGNFQQHIDKILKTTYKNWDKEYGLRDVEATVLAFRMLRLHGYHVSADVLKRFKDGNGTFASFNIETPTGIRSMLNLYKCAQISFPFELEVMGEAMTYARSQLKVLLAGDKPLLKTDNLRFEINFAINYPRICLLPRVESRSIIRQLWPSNGCKRKCLEFAKQDVVILQKQYKQEIYEIERWWDKYAVRELPFNRGQQLKSFFLVAATMFEQQFSMYRLVFTKSAALIVLIDDLYDYPTSDYDGLSRFTESIQRWDPSPLTNHPEHKAVFAATQSSMLDMATKSSMAQGRDLLPYFKTLWENIVMWIATEAEWKRTNYIPTLHEYLEIGECSVGAITCYCTTMFLLGDPITNEIMLLIDGDSRLLHLVGLISRIANDIVTYKREFRRGETLSSISIYMRENPGCTEEEAILSLRQMLESGWIEIEWELFRCHGVVPKPCRQAMLSVVRMFAFSYINIDAFTESSSAEFEDQYKDFLYGSLG